jgi:hypothetical protein
VAAPSGRRETARQTALDRRRVIADLVVAGRLRPAQFQPIEGRFAGQRRTIGAPRFKLAAQHCHDRVVAQLVVVDQVLVTQRNPEHPLTHQARHLVDHQVGRTVIGKAAGKALDQSDLPIGGAKQYRPGLRGHRPTVKRRHHLAPFNRCKAKQIRATLCLHRDSPAPEINRLCNSIFSDPGPRCTHPL